VVYLRGVYHQRLEEEDTCRVRNLNHKLLQLRSRLPRCGSDTRLHTLQPHLRAGRKQDCHELQMGMSQNRESNPERAYLAAAGHL